MIRILGTTRDAFTSNMIRLATGEDISHVAIRVNDSVIQSNGKGVHTEPYTEFIEKNRIIVEIRPRTDQIKSNISDRLNKKYPELEGKKYDFLAIAFIGIRIFLRKYLKIPFPKENLWDVSNMYICTELVGDLSNLRQNELLTPMQLIKELIKTGNWVQKS